MAQESWRNRLARWWRHPAAGEQGFGQHSIANQPLRGGGGIQWTGQHGSFWPTTSTYFGDDTRVTYSKARGLYANSIPEYKLGAGFARAIVNSCAGFMGVPTYVHAGDVEPANDELEEFFKRVTGVVYLAQRDAMVCGDSFVRLQYGPDPVDDRLKRFTLEQLVPEHVHPLKNPLAPGWLACDIEHPFNPPAPQRPFVLIETITARQVSYRVDGDAPDDFKREWEGKVETNKWGLIPIIGFLNESDVSATYGTSDLEPLEPFFRAYHDTLLVGLGGIQWFAKPKAVFNLADVDTFIHENMPEAARGLAPNFQGRDMFLMSQEDRVSFLTANPGTDGVAKLLELLFLNIVDTSETPEFVMGGAVASSKASVSEQQVPFVKKIERKRLQFTEAHRELAAKFLSMASKVGVLGAALDTYDVDLIWPEVAAKDEQATANTIKTLVDSFVAGVAEGLISAEAASDFLSTYVTTMLPWKDEEGGDTDERARIEEGLEFLEQAKTASKPPMPMPQRGNPFAVIGGPAGGQPPPGGGAPALPDAGSASAAAAPPSAAAG